MFGGSTVVFFELLGLVVQRRRVLDEVVQIEAARTGRSKPVVGVQRRNAGDVSDRLDAVRDVLLTLSDLDFELFLERLNLHNPRWRPNRTIRRPRALKTELFQRICCRALR